MNKEEEGRETPGDKGTILLEEKRKSFGKETQSDKQKTSTEEDWTAESEDVNPQ